MRFLCKVAEAAAAAVVVVVVAAFAVLQRNNIKTYLFATIASLFSVFVVFYTV